MKKFLHTRLAMIAFLAGSIFDVRGVIAGSIQAYASKRPRPKTVDEAFYMDANAIAGDMRQAMNKWGQEHAQG